jgi:hypothetical protein
LGSPCFLASLGKICQGARRGTLWILFKKLVDRMRAIEYRLRAGKTCLKQPTKGICTMKTSYTNVSQIEINVDLGIHEIETIITVLETKAEGDNGWQVKELLRQLKATKAESIRQIRDSLKTYA